ncbi:glycosyltransferase family 2 protein [Bradyrhizobium diazoefficiens]|uniref:glycosyltransferase family 2 protein n=1 Tax=Bradyrhizobium diazoefficiens TaxID=1355477 RepID=UPI00190CF59A|nr:glycosyltransferase family 2 protein [Bradyrhizobium diazoefficiens]QQO17700.1 glycosyltransferase family 2 protein [Bradyrhizobium diazoefficiens]
MTEMHAIILTLDEEKHIARCIESIRDQCASILVVDSGSKDRTREIAMGLGAEVIENPWINYATQTNKAIAACAGKTGWLMRIDADEYLTPASAAGLHELLERQPRDVGGIVVRRQIVFLGRRIKWGAIEPSWQLRLWRAGQGSCEQRWMDEHIVVTGKVVRSTIDLVDENLNSLDWWTSKHNRYASREVIDILASRGLLGGNMDIQRHSASWQAKLKRFVKERVYEKLPGGVRPLLFFLYRYLVRLGFLDGKQGYYFHILQGFWYRTLIDAKLDEIMALAKRHGIPVSEAVRLATGFDPNVAVIAPAEPPPRVITVDGEASRARAVAHG